jgi:hypothetical protein
MTTDYPDIAARVAKAAAGHERRRAAAKRGERIQRAGYKVAEFSAALGIDDSTATRWINKGIVRAIHIGGLTIIPSSEMDRLMREGSPRARKRMAARTADGKFIAGTDEPTP